MGRPALLVGDYGKSVIESVQSSNGAQGADARCAVTARKIIAEFIEDVTVSADTLGSIYRSSSSVRRSLYVHS